MSSHYLLPYTLHPTRMTDHSATVIDNIFSNNTEYDTFSGNILTNISNHYAQFLVISKVNISYKRCSHAKTEFSNFSEDKFVSDYSEIDNEFSHDPDIRFSSRFVYVLEESFLLCRPPYANKENNENEQKFHTKIINLMKYRDS